MNLVVDCAAGVLQAGGRNIACSIGRFGALPAAAKREGDGATPLGMWPVRAALLRPDRVDPITTALPWRWIRPQDGWSDAADDPAYNRPVCHPHGHSAERLWRDDGLYDIVVVLGHNDAPPVAGLGSAIFLHCWRDGATTEGCVAIARDELAALLPRLTQHSTIEIR